MSEKVRLTKFSQHSGCGAKLGPCALNETFKSVNNVRLPCVMADFTHSEDAGVIKISEDLALVQTVDFFPPIVDDPFAFGQITAANALSDLYAMGAKPISALSIVAFPVSSLDLIHLAEMTNGALNKLNEAGCALLGGHSIEDNELKYGFAITGTIHPDKVLYNRGGKVGDAIILTKPLGSGIINAALRGEMASTEAIDAFTRTMILLNKKAAEIIANYDISACTDVTGFGLLGHLYEMVNNTDIGAVVDVSGIKLLPDVLEYAAMGLIPGGAYNNREYCGHSVLVNENVERAVVDVLYDPQTSGGLLFMISADKSDEILQRMSDNGIEASLVGYTRKEKAGQIEVVAT